MRRLAGGRGREAAKRWFGKEKSALTLVQVTAVGGGASGVTSLQARQEYTYMSTTKVCMRTNDAAANRSAAAGKDQSLL